jgi:hypothetical protein
MSITNLVKNTTARIISSFILDLDILCLWEVKVTNFTLILTLNHIWPSAIEVG